jgi:hypothetical protein
MLYPVIQRAICVIGLFNLMFITACTHIQLKSNTIDIARTTADIQANQVLYNLVLAYKVYSNKDGSWNELPAFVQLGAAGMSVTDTGQATVTPTFPQHANAISSMLGLQGSRASADNWSATPINDPTQLQRLRGLYKLQFPHDSGDFKYLFPPPSGPVQADGTPVLMYRLNPYLAIKENAKDATSSLIFPRSQNATHELTALAVGGAAGGTVSNGGTATPAPAPTPIYGQPYKLFTAPVKGDPAYTTQSDPAKDAWNAATPAATQPFTPLKYFDVYYVDPAVDPDTIPQ